jgi:nucleotide-binding universal stress UspA family protein
MQVIAGTDFSENSAAAARVAARLADGWNDSVVLAHVAGEIPGDLTPDVREALAASETDRLHHEAAQLADFRVKVEERMLSGAPDQALVDLATKSKTRLLVVSSVGRRPGEWMLGSVAERTAEGSPVPVLVVRDAAPFERREREPLTIFIAYDFNEVSRKALEWVRHFLEIGPCEIVIGYVDWPPAEERRLGFDWPPFQRRNPPEVQAILERALREAAEAALGRAPDRVRCEPGMGRPDARLIRMAREEGAPLFVTGMHQFRGARRLWHPSVSRALLRNAPMNLLCVPLMTSEPSPAQSATICRVLAAVSLSARASHAAPYAYGIAPGGATVHLLHVAEPFHAPNPLIGGYPQPSGRNEKEHALALDKARRRLAAQEPEDASARGIATETAVVESSDVARAICQEAERINADVICVGPPGAALGDSVPRAVMSHSRRAVLVARSFEP